MKGKERIELARDKHKMKVGHLNLDKVEEILNFIEEEGNYLVLTNEDLEFLQNKTRYKHVALEIGGLRKRTCKEYRSLKVYNKGAVYRTFKSYSLPRFFDKIGIIFVPQEDFDNLSLYLNSTKKEFDAMVKEHEEEEKELRRLRKLEEKKRKREREERAERRRAEGFSLTFETGIEAEEDNPYVDMVNEEKVEILDKKILKPAIPEGKEGRGVYGICVKGELVYVGKTMRNFERRWSEHLACAANRGIQNAQQNYLYKCMRENREEIEFKVLFGINEEKPLTNKELECVEMGVIIALTPRFNYEGVKVAYRFTEEKRLKKKVAR